MCILSRVDKSTELAGNAIMGSIKVRVMYRKWCDLLLGVCLEGGSG